AAPRGCGARSRGAGQRPPPGAQPDRRRRRRYGVHGDRARRRRLEDSPMDALIVVDMQAGLLNGTPKHALGAVMERINRLADMVRGDGGAVIWIRHCGRPGDDFERPKPGWSFLPELNRQAGDLVVEKSLNDAFAG